MPDSRTIQGDKTRVQGPDEEIIWTLDVTNVGSSDGALSNLDMTVTTDAGTDVTATVTTGAMSSTGQVITLKTIQDLTEGTHYVVEVTYDKDSHSLGTKFDLVCD